MPRFTVETLKPPPFHVRIGRDAVTLKTSLHIVRNETGDRVFSSPDRGLALAYAIACHRAYFAHMRMMSGR